jgi:hypothetical protein
LKSSIEEKAAPGAYGLFAQHAGQTFDELKGEPGDDEVDCAHSRDPLASNDGEKSVLPA